MRVNLEVSYSLCSRRGSGRGQRSAGGGGGSSGDFSGSVLRHTLQDKLPKRLSEITIEGDVIEDLHAAAFKVKKINFT